MWVFAKGILAQRLKLKAFIVAEVHKSSIKFKDLKQSGIKKVLDFIPKVMWVQLEGSASGVS